MPFMHCPHCGAENFTMEGWEDLDHCSSCGKPLGESSRDLLDAAGFAVRQASAPRGRQQGTRGRNAKKPRRV
jgi:hypothetical protein